MNQLAIFINLFFVPLLSLIVIYREKQKPLEPNLDLLFQYGIITACNIPLTKVFIVLIREIGGRNITMDSGYYTLAAFLPTVLAFFCYKFYRTYPDHDPWKEKIIQKGIKGALRDLVPACILLFVSCFMLLFFEPILMYATNMDDFWFDLPIMIGAVLKVFCIFFLIGFVIIFAIYNIDLLISKRLLLYKGAVLAGFFAFFLLYLQGNWLAGSLPILEGDTIIWEDYGKFENFVLILFLSILAITMIVSIKKRGINRTVSYGTTCVSIVFVMLFTSLVPTMFTDGIFDSKDVYNATLKNFNTISTKENFLIFLGDCIDPKTFYTVMMEDDDFRDIMNDFTYYPDTLSTYPYTKDCVPLILTGIQNLNETNLKDYNSNAYNQSPFFEKLKKNNYSINLYSQGDIRWYGKRNYNVENGASIYDYSVDLNNFIKQELKYILFKYLPYGLKQFSEIETLDFDTSKISDLEYDKYKNANQEVYKRLTETSVLDAQSQNYFQYIHYEGSHRSYNMDKNLNTIKGGTEEQKVAATLTMIKTYLQRLKDNDAYDNSVIVIMSDHGNNSAENDKEHPMREFERYNTLLLIKGINEKHDEMLISDRSVSYLELNDAFCELLDGKQSTELFAELEPGRTRTVLWQTVGHEDHKIEYQITGKAWETDKFIPTGNVYDLEE